MSSQPIMHPRTASTLDSIIKAKPQSAMLVGPVGSGKMYLASYFASQILSDEQLDPKHHSEQIVYLRPNDKGIISIDDVRQLYSGTKSMQEFSKIVIIEDSQTMTQDAQNSFLKLLEEPPEKVIFLLTLDNPSHILPTISSRTKTITVFKPDQKQTTLTLSKIFTDHDKSAIEQSLIKSNGRIGLAVKRLNKSPGEVDSLETAKQLLAEPLTRRIVSIQSIMSERAQATATLEGLLTISSIAAKSAASQNEASRLAEWLHRQELCQVALKRLQGGANHKIQLLNVAIHL